MKFSVRTLANLYASSLTIFWSLANLNPSTCNILNWCLRFFKRTSCASSSTNGHFPDSIEYLGHIISSKGVEADHKKVESMTSWPTPRTIKSLRGFLGLTDHYCRFVRNYDIICKPLTDLLKKRRLWLEFTSSNCFRLIEASYESNTCFSSSRFFSGVYY